MKITKSSSRYTTFTGALIETRVSLPFLLPPHRVVVPLFSLLHLLVDVLVLLLLFCYSLTNVYDLFIHHNLKGFPRISSSSLTQRPTTCRPNGRSVILDLLHSSSCSSINQSSGSLISRAIPEFLRIVLLIPIP